jgi:hypothetical protein
MFLVRSYRIYFLLNLLLPLRQVSRRFVEDSELQKAIVSVVSKNICRI